MNEAAEKIVESYRVCFTGPNGAQVLADMIKEYVLPTGFKGNPNDAIYKQGARDVVLRILALVYRDGDAAYDTILSTVRERTE